MSENCSNAASVVARDVNPRLVPSTPARAKLEGLGLGTLVGGLCLILTPWIEVALLASAIAGVLGGLRVYGRNNRLP